ncbi:tRNA uracil 4-sulfurtransferase ThiI [Radiobacillus deserti]|uniref:Probable tRNA sulfurtransferase n=1 Tax=Radiobacillus deserti TaxID=2594883 RepID=A0A516KHI2_9BACI|nr:tRNA uracil 4-sulfurtransferase ThiI [Radiobacillus deserti]QDP40868.1 tRNA 4-thiouridine(8) synthase ThiI [Radiobacillus deserti]
MNYDHILIRYGEMTLKRNNRKIFVNQLHENVRAKLHDFPDIKVKANRDRMYILLNGTDPEPILEKCKDVFGISSFSLAIKADNEVDAIKEAALYALENSNAKTFKVTTKRINKDFPIGSQDLNQILGGHLLTNTEGFTVNVHEPDVEIVVEIRSEATFVTSTRIEGAGGLPVGSSGRTLLLLSGGIDSPVAGYLTMKRGVKLEVIHFHSPPFTNERAKQKVLDLVRRLTEFGHTIQVHMIPFTNLQQKIHRDIPHGYSMTVMRRMMLRISEAVAKKRDILSLTTGESLGQVASQTMESMHAINAVSAYPVLRPLIAMDKLDIIPISKQIGTYDISVLPYEDCCTIFIPNAPKTKPRLEKVEFFENQLELEEDFQEALLQMETIEITPNQVEEFQDLF